METRRLRTSFIASKIRNTSMTWCAPSRRIDRKSTRLNSSHVKISYAVFCLFARPLRSTLFPYTTLFRSGPRLLDKGGDRVHRAGGVAERALGVFAGGFYRLDGDAQIAHVVHRIEDPEHVDDVVRAFEAHRSEEHTSELQSRENLVCRLLLVRATTEIYPLSLHDALPIWPAPARQRRRPCAPGWWCSRACPGRVCRRLLPPRWRRADCARRSSHRRSGTRR